MMLSLSLLSNSPMFWVNSYIYLPIRILGRCRIHDHSRLRKSESSNDVYSRSKMTSKSSLPEMGSAAPSPAPLERAPIVAPPPPVEVKSSKKKKSSKDKDKSPGGGGGNAVVFDSGSSEFPVVETPIPEKLKSSGGSNSSSSKKSQARAEYSSKRGISAVSPFRHSVEISHEEMETIMSGTGEYGGGSSTTSHSGKEKRHLSNKSSSSSGTTKDVPSHHSEDAPKDKENGKDAISTKEHKRGSKDISKEVPALSLNHSPVKMRSSVTISEDTRVIGTSTAGPQSPGRSSPSKKPLRGSPRTTSSSSLVTTSSGTSSHGSQPPTTSSSSANPNSSKSSSAQSPSVSHVHTGSTSSNPVNSGQFATDTPPLPPSDFPMRKKSHKSIQHSPPPQHTSLFAHVSSSPVPSRANQYESGSSELPELERPPIVPVDGLYSLPRASSVPADSASNNASHALSSASSSSLATPTATSASHAASANLPSPIVTRIGHGASMSTPTSPILAPLPSPTDPPTSTSALASSSHKKMRHGNKNQPQHVTPIGRHSKSPSSSATLDSPLVFTSLGIATAKSSKLNNSSGGSSSGNSRSARERGDRNSVAVDRSELLKLSRRVGGAGLGVTGPAGDLSVGSSNRVNRTVALDFFPEVDSSDSISRGFSTSGSLSSPGSLSPSSSTSSLDDGVLMSSSSGTGSSHHIRHSGSSTALSSASSSAATSAAVVAPTASSSSGKSSKRVPSSGWSASKSSTLRRVGAEGEVTHHATNEGHHRNHHQHHDGGGSKSGRSSGAGGVGGVGGGMVSGGSAPDLVVEETYRTHRISPTSGYQIDTVREEPSHVATTANELAYEKWILDTFHAGPDATSDTSIFHYVPISHLPIDDLQFLTIKYDYTPDGKELASIKVLITYEDRDSRIVISSAQLRQSAKSLLKGSSKRNVSVRKLLQYVDPRLHKSNVKKIKANSLILDGLLTLARLRLQYCHADKLFKVGVMYWAGDKSDEATLASQGGTPAFNDFVNLLGDTIQLEGWNRFAGGLDTTARGMDGKSSVFTNWKGNELMFHVAPLMQCSAHQKRVHIGNDTLVIVFVDSKKPFKAEYVHSKFNQVFIVVSVETDESAIAKASMNAHNMQLISGQSLKPAPLALAALNAANNSSHNNQAHGNSSTSSGSALSPVHTSPTANSASSKKRRASPISSPTTTNAPSGAGATALASGEGRTDRKSPVSPIPTMTLTSASNNNNTTSGTSARRGSVGSASSPRGTSHSILGSVAGSGSTGGTAERSPSGSFNSGGSSGGVSAPARPSLLDMDPLVEEDDDYIDHHDSHEDSDSGAQGDDESPVKRSLLLHGVGASSFSMSHSDDAPLSLSHSQPQSHPLHHHHHHHRHRGSLDEDHSLGPNHETTDTLILSEFSQQPHQPQQPQQHGIAERASSSSSLPSNTALLPLQGTSVTPDAAGYSSTSSIDPEAAAMTTTSTTTTTTTTTTAMNSSDAPQLSPRNHPLHPLHLLPTSTSSPTLPLPLPPLLPVPTSNSTPMLPSPRGNSSSIATAASSNSALPLHASTSSASILTSSTDQQLDVSGSLELLLNTTPEITSPAAGLHKKKKPRRASTATSTTVPSGIVLGGVLIGGMGATGIAATTGPGEDSSPRLLIPVLGGSPPSSSASSILHAPPLPPPLPSSYSNASAGGSGSMSSRRRTAKKDSSVASSSSSAATSTTSTTSNISSSSSNGNSNGGIHPDSVSTWYRVAILRRDGIDSFQPKLPWPAVMPSGPRFREWLLAKVTSGMMAAFSSPNFQDRVQLNRSAYLKNLMAQIAEYES